MSFTGTWRDICEKYENAYRARTPGSYRAFQSAKSFPGGSDRSGTFYRPYPFCIAEAAGCRVKDIDNNEYIDFHNCFTVTVLGHAHPAIVQAIQSQASKGTVFGGPTLAVFDWADAVCRRIKSVQKIRFANSGSEAMMFAIRAARAFTGKDVILKMQDGFIGTYDPAMSPSDAPGLPRSVRNDSITVPFNDRGAVEKAIVENSDRLAAVVLEPMMGRTGQIPPLQGYLPFVRDIASAHGVLLVFDEIQCFRVDYGGAQNIFGVEPDITVLGKIIGGGLAVGALGGRADIMDQLSPGGKIYHSGTFTSNALTAAAGLAALQQLTISEIARINQLGERLAVRLRQLIDNAGVKAQVTGRGSLQNLHFSTVPVIDGRTSVEARKKYQDVRHIVFLALLDRGILSNEAGLFSISTPMSEREVDLAADALEEVLGELVPHLRNVHPELAS